MANKNAAPGFTIRVPQDLLDLIDSRSVAFRRSRNQEVVYLLERALKGLQSNADQSSPATSSEQ